ncbi:hypothetical protein HQ571_05165 [Candidatus Kuenenbacteria bacterium]|nr:hypothetical protein [Candidatus Kuenenbacteria bacterium]
MSENTTEIFPVSEHSEVDYERECFSNLRGFVGSFGMLETLRSKKNIKQPDKVAQALEECSEWYDSAVNFLLANQDNSTKIERFWAGLEKQMDRISREISVMHFEEIQTNIARQTALLQIFKKVNPDAKFTSSDFNLTVPETMAVGHGKVVEGSDELDSEFSLVSFELNGKKLLVGALNFTDEKHKNRFTTDASDPDAEMYYVRLSSNDFDHQTGKPKTKAAEVIRSKFNELGTSETS